jgi:hypothetical protein
MSTKLFRVAPARALRKLTACLVHDARQYQPAGRVSERVQTRKSVTEPADEEGSDDRGNDRFAWRPVELEFHADLFGGSYLRRPWKAAGR